MVCLGKTMSTQTSDNNKRIAKKTLLYSACSVLLVPCLVTNLCTGNARKSIV
mgnify:FL=1